MTGTPEPYDRLAGIEDDLRALAEADADLERDAEVAERTRIERGSVALADRLRGARGPVELVTVGGGRHAGRISDGGAGWVLLEHVPVGSRAATAQHLVLTAALLAVRGLGRPRVPPPSGLPPRPVTAVLREWCRDRSSVSALLVDGSVHPGLASAVFADHLELSSGGATVALPLAALAVVSR